MPDAVVVGAGPNGLVAANLLADAGWRVVVLEAQRQPGGAVRSDRGLDPAFVSDLCSSFYPLAAVSPVIAGLGLDRYGLAWSRAPLAVAHPLPGSRCAVIGASATATAERIADVFGAADARAWLALSELWAGFGPRLVDLLLRPFPSPRATLALGLRLRSAGLLRTLRFLTLPARRLAEEQFAADGPRLLLTGCAMHSDLSPDTPGSALLGWMMAMLGQETGWPVPVGGASALTDALVRRLEARGGSVLCGARVTEVEVRDGRAVGVRTADGSRCGARRAVLADVSATSLYGGLVPWSLVPARLRADLRRFHWDPGTVKVDWALSGPIPWTAGEAAGAGTVHLGATADELSDAALQVATGRVPREPFVVVGQMSTADPTRSPAGTQAAWAYTHVPQRIRADLGAGRGGSGGGGVRLTGEWDDRAAAEMADRLERRIERFAPGFRDVVSARRILTPADLEAMDANLVGGAVGGGTSNLHQQLVFRPTPGAAGARTPIRGLYLASAAAHPGGGVHGACGANAARAALRAHRLSPRRYFSGQGA